MYGLLVLTDIYWSQNVLILQSMKKCGKSMTKWMHKVFDVSTTSSDTSFDSKRHRNDQIFDKIWAHTLPKGIHFSMDLLFKGANLCFIHLYRFSMGLRSGLLAGQSASNSNSCSSKNFFVAQDVWGLTLSCWRANLSSLLGEDDPWASPGTWVTSSNMCFPYNFVWFKHMTRDLSMHEMRETIRHQPGHFYGNTFQWALLWSRLVT